MLAVATALGMPAKVICGFQDADVNRLLDVDPDREVAFSLVALGHFAALAQQLPSELSAIDLESVPLSLLGINGTCGRMGQRLVILGHEDTELSLGAALESAGHPQQGRDIGEVCGIGKLGVSRPTRRAARSSSRRDDRLFDARRHDERPQTVSAAAHSARRGDDGAHACPASRDRGRGSRDGVADGPEHEPCGQRPLQARWSGGGDMKDRGFDVEILERHHRFKKDSPSGTALHFARIVQQAMGQTEVRHGREGIVGERPGHEIGIHAIRAGDNVGEHTIVFSTLGETLELVHKGHSRDSYARGALAAAKFLAGRPPGRYTMEDVLAL